MTTTPPTPAADATDELIAIAREIEALKQECGMDPESPRAIQNSRYMNIAYKVRALALRPAPVAATGKADERAWQPIETAPKDGTDVIVMYMHIDTQIVHNAFWISAEEVDEELFVGWWTYTHSEVSRELDDWRTPTHWMPLPAPAPPALSTPETTPPTQPKGERHE